MSLKKGSNLKKVPLLRKALAFFAVVILFALYVNLRIINREAERLKGPGRMEEIPYEARLQPLKLGSIIDATSGYIITSTSNPIVRKMIFFTVFMTLLFILGAGQASLIYD